MQLRFMSRYRKGGIPDLTMLGMIGGIILAGIIILSAILVIGYLEGIDTNVLIIVKQDDEGTTLNSLLLTDMGEGRYADLLGLASVEGFQFSTESIESSLEKLDLSLAVSGVDKKYFTSGVVRPDLGKFIDFPLPGLRRGKLGIDFRVEEDSDERI